MGFDGADITKKNAPPPKAKFNANIVKKLLIGAAKVVGGAAAFFVVLGVIIIIGAEYQTSHPPEKKITAKDIKRKMLQDISMDIEWRKTDLYSVMIADFVISNMSAHGIKDIAISCDIYGKSGTRIGEARQVIYDNVSKSSSKTFSEVNMGVINPQAEKARCEIVNFGLSSL